MQGDLDLAYLLLEFLPVAFDDLLANLLRTRLLYQLHHRIMSPLLERDA